MGAVVRRAPRTVAVSQFGVGEIVRFFGGNAARISVVTEGWEHLERVDADEGVWAKHGLRPGNYVLAVSSPTPNKNFGLVLAAAERLRGSGVQFAVVGAADPKVFARARLEAAENVRQLGYVSDAELKALYAGATCFVFPSRYEGFGIPPLEALSCGCPVLVSDIEPLREVCGEVAQYFDPGDVDALVRLIEQAAAAPVTPAVRERAKDQAARFSWTRGAELNLRAVRECLEHRTG